MGNFQFHRFCIDERYADAIYRPNVYTPTISKQTLLVHNLPHKSHKSSEEVYFVILYHSFTYHSILALPPVCKTNICLKCHIRHLFTAYSVVWFIHNNLSTLQLKRVIQNEQTEFLYYKTKSNKFLKDLIWKLFSEVHFNNNNFFAQTL